jgi:predicted ATPase
VGYPTTESGRPADALVERSRELAAIGEWLEDVRTGTRGRCVLVAGEAGVGKTTLLREICATAGKRTRMLWGACDSLFTPQPLGPLLDIADVHAAFDLD